MIHELRIYTAHPGKLPALQARFRDHTVGIFERCGIKNVAYWTNSIGGRSDELWYVIAFEDMAQRDEAWATFISDPEWRQVARRVRGGRPPRPPHREPHPRPHRLLPPPLTPVCAGAIAGAMC